jgi:hypothetical protein
MAKTLADLSVEELMWLWRYSTLEDSVEEAADALVKGGLATEQRGASESVLTAADARLGRPIPEDLRYFYRRVTPVSSCPFKEFGFVGFRPADDPDLQWITPQALKSKLGTTPYEHNWLKGWQAAHVLVFGYTPFGDSLLWCDGLEGRPSGTIVLTDHEGSFNPVVLGDSFSQWLARYRHFGFVEHAVLEAGLDAHQTSRVALAFLSDHVRLNPGCRWAAEKLKLFEQTVK